MRLSFTSLAAAVRQRWGGPSAGWPEQPPLGRIVRSRPFVVAAGGYLALLAVMFWPLATGGVLSAGAATAVQPPFVSPASVAAVPYVFTLEGDFVEQFAPFQQYQYDAARAGRFPTWNPHINLGQPFHGNGQSAMLDPFHWPYFLVDPNRARGPVTALRLAVSALATFALLRKLGVGPAGAFVAGAAYTFGSFNLHWLLWPHSAASLWLPVVLLAIDYVLVRPTWRGYAAAALATTPLLLTGHPGSMYLCMVVVAVWSTVRWAGAALAGRTGRQLGLMAVAGGGALATGVVAASAALLPLVLQVRQSFDYLDPAGHRITAEPLAWSSLWLFLVPEYHGRQRGGYPNVLYIGSVNYIELTLWVGAMTLALAVAALVRPLVDLCRGATGARRVDRPTFAPTVAVALLAVAIPAVFVIRPVYGLITLLPGTGLTSLRRMAVGLQFAAAVLAGVSVDRLVRLRDRTTAVVVTIGTLAAAVAVVAVVASKWADVQQLWAAGPLAALPAAVGAAWPTLVDAAAVQDAGHRMLAGAGLLVAGTAVVGCVAWQVVRGRPSSPTLRYLLVGLVAVDVLLPGADLSPIPPRDIAVPPAPAVLRDMVARAGDGRVTATDRLLPPNLSMQYGFRDVRGYDLPHDPRLVDVYRRLKIDGEDERGLMTLDRFYPYVEPALAAYLDRTCTRQLMAYEPEANAPAVLSALHLLGAAVAAGGQDWPQVDSPGGGVLVFANPNAYPRAYLAKAAVRAADPAQALDALLDPAVDLRERSTFEGGPTPRTPATGPAADPVADACRVRSDEPERVLIDCKVPEGGDRLLVLADRMADGWSVDVDGRPAVAVAANYLFRGVLVPPGHHTVDWTYTAPGLAAGVTLSTITLAGLLTVLALPTVRDRLDRRRHYYR